MSSALAHCPFCGSPAFSHPEKLWSPSRRAWLHAVECGSSTCEAFGPLAGTPQAAMQAWNERARRPIASLRTPDLFAPEAMATDA